MEKLSTFFRNASIAVVGTAVAVPAFAAIDEASIVAGIDAASGKALTVGQGVCLAVVSLVVVGIILGVVRKV